MQPPTSDAPPQAASAPPSFSRPHDALAALLAKLQPVATQQVSWKSAPGRVLAQNVLSDRPSPSNDVSAMDGYAVRVADVYASPEFPVAGAVLPGQPAPTLPHNTAIRIMTGAAVPVEADAVIRREDVEELPDRIRLRNGVQVTAGQSIRRRGENLSQGQPVLPAGRVIDAPAMGAIAAFGAARLLVRRRVRVAVVVTGDELLPVEAAVEPWQIRDSNGPTLAAMFAALPWIKLTTITRVRDDRGTLLDHVGGVLGSCDALLVTGGVSMGTHDFVPDVLGECGVRTIFHRLPMRPGHPVLGGVGPQGQLVMGLPGNPLSVLTTARLLAMPALMKRGGITTSPAQLRVRITNPDGKAIKLWWYRPVRLTADGDAELVPNRGSGDVPAAAASDGFVEIPPGDSGAGPWPFYSWSAG